MNNIDINEINKFSYLVNDWWNPNGKLKTLHQINPLRLKFIKKLINLNNKNIIDIGCGCGILTESLSKYKNNVYGLDISKDAIVAAKNHAKKNNLKIKYINSTIEQFSIKNCLNFDIITCMEMLEHVLYPESIIASVSKILKNNGLFFISTLNRTLKSYILSIIIAEYVLKIIPKGTHSYNKFIKPYELINTAEKYGFKTIKVMGISYNPIINNFKFTNNINVNYIIAFKK